MDMIIERTKQDMATAIEALKKDEFDFINIIGNRIATDLMIGHKNDLILIGFILKEVSSELERIRAVNETNLPKCKEMGIKFFEELQSLLVSQQLNCVTYLYT